MAPGKLGVRTNFGLAAHCQRFKHNYVGLMKSPASAEFLHRAQKKHFWSHVMYVGRGRPKGGAHVQQGSGGRHLRGEVVLEQQPGQARHRVVLQHHRHTGRVLCRAGWGRRGTGASEPPPRRGGEKMKAKKIRPVTRHPFAGCVLTGAGKRTCPIPNQNFGRGKIKAPPPANVQRSIRQISGNCLETAPVNTT